MSADDAALERAHEIFDPIADRYLQRPEVDFGPMFGSKGLRVRGKVFAFLGHAGGLIVKVPEARVTDLVAQGAAQPMVIRERTLREWVVVDVHSGPEWWDDLIDEAFEYLDEITP